jgi:ABC-2 type transport system permease protein
MVIPMTAEARGVFWSLVRQNMRGVKRSKPWFQKPWRTVYLVTVLLVFVVVATYVGLFVKSPIDLSVIWFFVIGLPFAAFGNGIGLIVHEWKNGTVGWWLSLPLSRMQLIMAKFVAALLRTILFFSALYIFINFLGWYTLILQGTFSVQAAAFLLTSGLKWYALLICACPFAAAFGMLIGVLTESRAKPILPLIWIIIGALWWLVTSHGFAFLKINIVDGHLVFFHFSLMLLYPFVASLIIAYVILHVAAYLLERQLAI